MGRGDWRKAVRRYTLPVIRKISARDVINNREVVNTGRNVFSFYCIYMR